MHSISGRYSKKYNATYLCYANRNFNPANILLFMQSVTIQEISKVIALQDLPTEHLQWLIDHGEYNEYDDGSVISKTGEPIDHLWMIIEGKGNFYMDISGRLIHFYTFENNKEKGGIGGLIPYSRMKTSPGFTIAEGKLRVFLLHKTFFQQLEQMNPAFIQRLISFMTERARVFATHQLQHEKVNELGKLSAGIAHELNNPASAITRISDELNKRLLLNYEHTEMLLQHRVDSDQIKKLREIVDANRLTTEKKTKLTALQTLEREDELRNWLETNNLEKCIHASGTFTVAGWTIEDLDKIRGDVDDHAFCTILLWLENLLSSGWIIKDLEEASTRISKLVGAIKSHVHMDRTNDLLPTNIHTGIENTITILGHKLREKNITVKKHFDEFLPDIEANVGELNQVWSNIIDNAIFAIPQEGELQIETSHSKNDVTINFRDNGAGIPAEILKHIFEPYFTTKNVGDGSGIGLDIVNRIIKNHRGKIEVNSSPGHTEFKISLPIVQNP